MRYALCTYGDGDIAGSLQIGSTGALDLFDGDGSVLGENLSLSSELIDPTLIVQVLPIVLPIVLRLTAVSQVKVCA